MYKRHDETLRLTPVTCNIPPLDKDGWHTVQSELRVEQDFIAAFLVLSGMWPHPPAQISAVR
jgi:hypothetical protein